MTDETATIVVKSRSLERAGDTTMSEQLLSVEDAADELGISLSMVRRYIREERLKATMIGNSYVILRSDLEDFKERRPGRGRPPETN